MKPGRNKQSRAALWQGPVSLSEDTHNTIFELFCSWENVRLTWYAAHNDVDPRPVVLPKSWLYVHQCQIEIWRHNYHNYGGEGRGGSITLLGKGGTQ